MPGVIRWNRVTGAEVVKRVLVVDDDALIRGVIVGALEDEGYAVTEAADGLGGLAELARLEGEGETVHAVLLDYQMPRCDGGEVARRLRERDRPAPPIILLSATTDLRERCRIVRAAGCIGKPFDLDTLVRTVGRVGHDHPDD